MKCESCGAILKEARCEYCGTTNKSFQTHTVKVDVKPIIEAINKQQPKITNKAKKKIEAEIEKQVRDKTISNLKKEIEAEVEQLITEQETQPIEKPVIKGRTTIQFWLYTLFGGIFMTITIYALCWIYLVNQNWKIFSARGWSVTFLNYSMLYRPSLLLVPILFILTTGAIKLLQKGKLLRVLKNLIMAMLILELFSFGSNGINFLLIIYVYDIFLGILLLYTLLRSIEIRTRRKKGLPFLINILGAIGLIFCLLIVEVRNIFLASMSFIVNGYFYSGAIYFGILLLYTVLILLEISRRRKSGISWDANLKGIERLNPKQGLAVLESAEKINKEKVSYKTALIALTSANIPLYGAKWCLEGKELEIDVKHIKEKLKSPKGIVGRFPHSLTAEERASANDGFKKIREEEASKKIISENQGLQSSSPSFESVDINQASELEIAKLPRVNLILAKKIIGVREGLGGFVSFEQFVQEVNLSQSIAEAVKDRVIFSGIKEEYQSSKGRLIDY